jgi:hypothetical protein
VRREVEGFRLITLFHAVTKSRMNSGFFLGPKLCLGPHLLEAPASILLSSDLLRMVTPCHAWSSLSVLCRSLWACEGGAGSLGQRPRWEGADGPSPPTPLPQGERGGDLHAAPCGARGDFPVHSPRMLRLFPPRPLRERGWG